MFLTGITQRERLFEIASRWLADRLEPEDGRRVTEIFLFESMINPPTAQRFLAKLQAPLRPQSVQLVRMRTKDELRRLLAATSAMATPRAAELFAAWRADPESFFPRTPIDLSVLLREDGSPFAMVRVKRIRRIAEKTSRRIAERLIDEIRRIARELASRRATREGLSIEGLVSTSQAMAQDFRRAEGFVAQSFRDHDMSFTHDDLRIDDVLGIKVIGTPDELERVEREIESCGIGNVTQREEHRGRYNDVNLLVDLRLPEPGRIIDDARNWKWQRFAGRGLTEAELRAALPAYVESGARTIRAEVILTTPDELLESEFGRSIHEERILAQRQGLPYTGRIAQNASFIVEYLLMLAVSPTVEIAELPVKMWGRYLPDVFALEVWKLFGFARYPELVESYVPEE